MKNEKYITTSEKETIEIGSNFAERLRVGDSVCLYGDLGSGKTEFIKGICKFFHVHELVTSPTFTIMNQYLGSHGSHKVPIYHIDLYRIKSQKELEEIGFNECMDYGFALKLVEWADKAEGQFPAGHYSVTITSDMENENNRTIEIEKFGEND